LKTQPHAVNACVKRSSQRSFRSLNEVIKIICLNVDTYKSQQQTPVNNSVTWMTLEKKKDSKNNETNLSVKRYKETNYLSKQCLMVPYLEQKGWA